MFSRTAAASASRASPVRTPPLYDRRPRVAPHQLVDVVFALVGHACGDEKSVVDGSVAYGSAGWERFLWFWERKGPGGWRGAGLVELSDVGIVQN